MMKGQKRLSKSALQSEARQVLDRGNDKFIDNDSPFNWINYAEIHGENRARFTPHFLAWHRIYSHYFEKAVRSITGESKFTLPYWSYNDSAQRKLPEAFADSTSAFTKNQEKRHQQTNSRSRSVQINEDDSLYVKPQSHEHFSEYLKWHPHVISTFKFEDVAPPTRTSAQDPIA